MIDKAVQIYAFFSRYLSPHYCLSSDLSGNCIKLEAIDLFKSILFWNWQCDSRHSHTPHSALIKECL